MRPIQRGKVEKPTEFGAKLSMRLTDEGIAQINYIRWDAFHEGHDLLSQVETYKRRYGFLDSPTRCASIKRQLGSIHIDTTID